MFKSCSSIQKITAGLLLFSAGIAGGLYVYNHTQAPAPLTLSDSQSISIARQKLTDVLKAQYPDCHEAILAVYDATGATPLVVNDILKHPNEAPLTLLNKTLQALFLRDKKEGRHQLEDATYLPALQTRLDKAYGQAGLRAPLLLDEKTLRTALSTSTLWSSPTAQTATPMKIDMALLFGSSYQEYLNRQSFFFKLRSEKAVHLMPDATGKFPTYLLGGDRDLDPKIDGPAFSALPLNKHGNEQTMMNMLFEKAIQAPDERASGLTPLYAIATDSAKEDNNRPTTAGTLDSFAELAQLKSAGDKHILAISSAPFIRYQHLVAYRQFLKYGLDMDKIHLTTLGPNLDHQIKSHPELAQKAFIAICLDNLAREVYEMKAIEDLKLKHTAVSKPKP